MKLTSSRFAAAIGLNPYQSRQKLWRVMNGMESTPFVAAMQWGIDHELDAVSGAERITGIMFRDTGDLQKHYTMNGGEYEYGTTPDGRSFDIGLEVKCPSKVWDEPPAYYVPQIIGQAAIAGMSSIYFSCWTPREQRVWLFDSPADHWDWMHPLLNGFMDCFRDGEQPKRQKKPELPELTIERIA